jgi:hypothetical protein
MYIFPDALQGIMAAKRQHRQSRRHDDTGMEGVQKLATGLIVAGATVQIGTGVMGGMVEMFKKP